MATVVFSTGIRILPAWFLLVAALAGQSSFAGTITLVTCPDFLYQAEFGKPILILLVPSHPAGAARRESFSGTAARRLQGRDAVAA